MVVIEVQLGSLVSVLVFFKSFPILSDFILFLENVERFKHGF